METERLMQAVLQSFLDADLRVEVLAREDKPSTTMNAGTSPSRERYDANTQAMDGRYAYKQPRSETVRRNLVSAPELADSTAQAVDGRYATVYKVHHCKMTPTSPPVMATEFPPQRPDVSYGGDNFQVGGTGSGVTGGVPIKATCYRGAGLNWPSRGAVCTPRMSRCSDSFASSLRKYPSISPERSSEVIERLVNYSMPRTSISRSPRHSPHHTPGRSPPREPISYRSPKTYEESYAANSRPRAPEDSPTRDKREDLRKQIHKKQGDIRLIREVSRRLRKTLKSISTYSHTQTLPPRLAGCSQEWCDTPIPETSETDHEQDSLCSPRVACTHPVNTKVQAVAPTSSLGVETKYPSKRTIAVPVSPSPSSRLSPRANNLSDPVTRSVQTFEMPRRSVDTITSTTELTKHDHVKLVVKKSKSLSDFRLHKNFKSEILAWLDDTSDPKIKEIQDAVLRNLSYRLNGSSMVGAEKIKVKLGNCLKQRIDSKQPSSYEFSKKHGFHSNTQSLDEFSADGSRIETDQNVFEDVIKEWLSDVPIKKRDIFLRPVRRDQIYNTFVNRLKHLVFEKPKNGREQLLREEISEILDEVPIEVNTSDKIVYVNRMTDALIYRLENILQDQTKTRPFKCNMPAKSNTCLRRSRSPLAGKETKDTMVNAMLEVLKKENAINPNMIKQTIVDLVDILMNSVNTNIRLKEIASVIHNATKLSEKEAFQFAAQLAENCKDLNNKKYSMIAKSQPLAVFMVQKVSRNYITKTSGTNMSRHSIGSIVDKDIEANLNQYKMKLAQQIDRWLSDLAVLRENDTDFRQAVVLDLASDLVDRQKYLEFNKDSGTDMDELEHLKYQIFKWMKRYLGENNMEAVDHATELMELIRNIPVPMINRSQYHLYKSNSGICCQDVRFEPCTSTDICANNVYGSKSDSGICNREESHSGLGSTHIRGDNNTNMKDEIPKQIRQKDQKSSTFNRSNVILNLSTTSVHDSSKLSKRSLNNAKNSCETSKHKHTHGEHSIHTIKNEINQSIGINRERHISQETHMSATSARSRDNLCKSNSGVNCRDGTFEPGTTNNSNDDVIDVLNSKSHPTKCHQKEPQSDAILINYMVHKVSPDTTNDSRDQKSKKLSTSGRKNTTTNTDFDYSKRSSKHKRKSLGKSPKLHSESNSDSQMQARGHSESANQNDEHESGNISHAPGPSEQRTPSPYFSMPSYSGRPSSLAAKLIADWRPPPVFTPPPPGLPLISQLQEDFQEYLKNWCQQIPISSNTPEEINVAEKARMGILNGIWKIITKIKTQPAVFKNKFYYEDVLGKEINGLLDCLPQTQELQEKRYALQAQLLEKHSDMIEMIKELEMPENYRDKVADKKDRIEDDFNAGKLRTSTRTEHEDPIKLFEQMLKYCTLDDFLIVSNYKETNKILANAYKNKLLEAIQAFMDRLKNSHGKEMENLTNVYTESEINAELYKVPLPNEDSIKENADEILLGLEIEEWMKDLPLVQNDDIKEKLHRRRLAEALTKRIHEMEKRANISDCCGDAQIRHEISVFLDKVPLEKNQDLKINEMADEFNNRLKSRHGVGSRRKSVAFQDGHQNQSVNQSNRLQNRSRLANGTIGPDRRYSGNEWPVQQDEDAQNISRFENPPLCSTRNGQPDDEWAMEEDQDAQYRSLFKNKPACSSMIEPQGGYGPGDNAPAPPDYPRSGVPLDQGSYFVYNPDQFHESARGGAFGYSMHNLPPHDESIRFQYPNLVSSRRGSQQQSRYFESEAGLIPNASFPDDQYQPSHSFVSVADAEAPPMMRRSAYTPSHPPAASVAHWDDQNEASGFISMAQHGLSRPQMHIPGHFSNEQPPYNSHRSQIDPNISQGAAGFHSMHSEQPYIEPVPFIPDASRLTRSPNASRSNRIGMQSEQPYPNISQGAAGFHSMHSEQPYIEPVPFIPDASRLTRSPNASRSNRIEMEPSMMRQEPNEISVHENQRFSRGSSRGAMSHRSQANATGGFMSMPSHQTPGAMAAPLESSVRNQSGFMPMPSHQTPGAMAAPMETSGRNQSGVMSMPSHQTPGAMAAPLENSVRNQSGFMSMPSHQTPGAMAAPLENSVRNHSFREVNQPSIRISPTSPQEFRRSTDREGIQEIIIQNRSANRSVQDIQAQGPSQGPQSRQTPIRNPVPTHGLGESAGGAPSSPQRSDRRLIASNAPSSEISNQPGFFSTPEQRANLVVPPNLRERRQIEQERGRARRVDMDTEENEGEERCRCRQRYKRWIGRQGPNCTTCEECVQDHGPRGFYPYPYPYPYPYVPFGRPPPPNPPYCRR